MTAPINPKTWPWDAVPGRSDWDNEVVEQAEVCEALHARGVTDAGVAQTGGWVMCVGYRITMPDFVCEVLAANHDGTGWGASISFGEGDPREGEPLGDTYAAQLDPIAPSMAHPALIADVLVSLDWAEIVRRSEGRV